MDEYEIGSPMADLEVPPTNMDWVFDAAMMPDLIAYDLELDTAPFDDFFNTAENSDTSIFGTDTAPATTGLINLTQNLLQENCDTAISSLLVSNPAVAISLDDAAQDGLITGDETYQLADISYSCYPQLFQESLTLAEFWTPKDNTRSNVQVVNDGACDNRDNDHVECMISIAVSSSSTYSDETSAYKSQKSRRRKTTPSPLMATPRIYQMNPSNPPDGYTSKQIRKAIACHNFQEKRKQIGELHISYQEKKQKLKQEIHKFFARVVEQEGYVQKKVINLDYLIEMVQQCIRVNEELAKEARKQNEKNMKNLMMKTCGQESEGNPAAIDRSETALSKPYIRPFSSQTSPLPSELT